MSGVLLLLLLCVCVLECPGASSGPSSIISVRVVRPFQRCVSRCVVQRVGRMRNVDVRMRMRSHLNGVGVNRSSGKRLLL